MESIERRPSLGRRARFALRSVYDRSLVATGTAVGRLGRRLVLHLHRDEVVDVPEPLDIEGHVFDVVAELVEYTGLPREEIVGLVRRERDSFRAEWYLAPRTLQRDDWYYLASSGYLWGNATHDPTNVVETIERHCGRSGRALEFGGGTGNLALALAALGWSVDYVERSALQKDFVRYRVDKHRLGDRVRILDSWRSLETGAYDLVCALDVFEHVEDLEALLGERLLPSMRSGAALTEASPFVRNLSNPMHHEHTNLDQALLTAGFYLAADTADCRVWRSQPTSA